MQLTVFVAALLMSMVSARTVALQKNAAAEVCPDPFSPCQYAEDDGTCTIGYEGCIKKMGCNTCVGGEADCIGCASGTFSSTQTVCPSLTNIKISGCTVC